MTEDAAARIVGLYERHAHAFDRERLKILFEKAWLDRLIAQMPPDGDVLDLGCGMGEPIARYVIEQGLHVTGVDSAPSMIALCRSRFPAQDWMVADMRRLMLGRTFDGVVAFDSFFHLTQSDQRAMFPVFAAHASSGAPLMFTSGPRAGVAMGTFQGEPLYHASLDPGEYRALLDANDFAVQTFVPEAADCNGRSVWLARKR